jgi:hypothetical protein
MSFKMPRFNDDKMVQIEQLISYATMLGLSGSDLISIGGKMAREQVKHARSTNMEIIKGFDCLPIGHDANSDHGLGYRFKLKTANGTFKFEHSKGYLSIWTVTSVTTKTKLTHLVNTNNYVLPKTTWYTLSRYAILLDIAAGRFRLNF